MLYVIILLILLIVFLLMNKNIYNRINGYLFHSKKDDSDKNNNKIKFILNKRDISYIQNLISLKNKKCDDLKTPRVNMVCFNNDIDIKHLISESFNFNYTRYPICESDKDNIIGYINIKELMMNYFNDNSIKLSDYIIPVTHISEKSYVLDVLYKFQEDNSQMYILVDEYGGVSGLITLEDVLESLVGNIKDEFDLNEKDDIEYYETNETYNVSGKVLISELENLLSINLLEEENINTIGGLFLYKEVDNFDVDGYNFNLVEREGMYIKRIEISQLK